MTSRSAVVIRGTNNPRSVDVKSSKAALSGVGVFMPTFCETQITQIKEITQIKTGVLIRFFKFFIVKWFLACLSADRLINKNTLLLNTLVILRAKPEESPEISNCAYLINFTE